MIYRLYLVETKETYLILLWSRVVALQRSLESIRLAYAK